MEFRLIYEGELPVARAGSARLDEKHAIRKQIHKQLAALWKVQQPLVGIATRRTVVEDAKTGTRHEWSGLDEIARTYNRAGFNFVPLISKLFGLVCSLDILFLRRESPGQIITHGGDLDNRVKTLFDALRMPKDATELPSGATPEQGEEYFYCLLEDDALITEFSATTDRLLAPLRDREDANDVYLVIKVKAMISDPRQAYIEFAL